MVAGPARLLDLTRSVSRLGRGPMTGIDRVEAAWAAELVKQTEPALALIRTGAGFLLLDRVGMAALLTTDLPARADGLARLTHRRHPAWARAETLARRLAVARCSRFGLARMVRRWCPAGGIYLNLGHANLVPRTLRQVQRGGLKVTVLIHDTIPLDHPDLVRVGSPDAFRRKLAAVVQHADRVIHLTAATRQLTEGHFARLGRVPPGCTAPLGVMPARPDPAALPAGPTLSRPYFVALGTIEPRKNIGLLLDVWDVLAAPPQLLLIGARGWAGADLLARLDALPPGGAITELNGLPDDAVAALLAGARALLFPSLAEGYGLPPLEAAALGVPVLALKLPVIHETLGDYPVYLNDSNRYSWATKIEELVQTTERAGQTDARIVLPTWEAHFNAVLSPA
ncbi:glycosyltransferase [Fuscibacter oryzae]|uniref:Glycosyltransferase n=1 Tax=Fuscibacter oryzae TaxID=2803939 RepID=A0A8J7MU65_9RHOB|nr:glycosyltransferase [Fuscibacter oryzae]MBL4929677.1 glycosyltransferase [Fuscibacter oryzae]